MDCFFQSCSYPALSDVRRTFESLAGPTANLKGQQPLSAASAQDALDTDRDLSFYQSHNAVPDISRDHLGSAARLSAVGMVGESRTRWRDIGTLSQRYTPRSAWQTEELQTISEAYQPATVLGLCLEKEMYIRPYTLCKCGVLCSGAVLHDFRVTDGNQQLMRPLTAIVPRESAQAWRI